MPAMSMSLGGLETQEAPANDYTSWLGLVPEALHKVLANAGKEKQSSDTPASRHRYISEVAVLRLM